LEAEHIKTRVMGMIDILLKDVVKAKIKDADKNYNRIDRRGKEVINSQDYFEEQANIFEKKYYKEEIEEIFVPIMSHEPDEMS
jgi:polyphosphate kinase